MSGAAARTGFGLRDGAWCECVVSAFISHALNVCLTSEFKRLTHCGDVCERGQTSLQKLASAVPTLPQPVVIKTDIN